MRKTIISLILVIPLVFVLVVFSSVKLISLGVDIAVNGIRIHADNMEDGAVYIDLAEEGEYTVSAQVLPENAKDRSYTLKSDDPAVAEVTADGKLLPKKEGTAVITATSNDKGFTDSLSVVVAASRPYDFGFSILDREGNNLAVAGEDGFTATLDAGTYGYSVSVLPAEFTGYTLAADSAYVKIDEGMRTICLPFSGTETLLISVPDGAGGMLEKRVRLTVNKPSSVTGIVVNGDPDGTTVLLDKEALACTLYVECPAVPEFFTAEEGVTAKVTTLGGGKYRIDVQLAEAFGGERFNASLTSSDQRAEINFSFEDFDYRVTSDFPIQTTEDGPSAAVTVGNACRFYAVSTVSGADVTYEWTLDGAPQSYLTVSAGGTSCSVSAAEEGQFVLRVRALRGGEELSGPREIAVHAVIVIGAVRITNDVDVDLAEYYTVAGQRYDETLHPVAERYALNISTYTPGRPLARGGDEIVYSVSEPQIARIEKTDGGVYLVPEGRGEVTVTAEWKWNGWLGKNLRASIILNVLSDAIAVTNAEEYMKAMEEGRVTVLKNDISLGTDRNGEVYDVATRNAMLKRARSTYNIEWYKHASLVPNETLTEADAYFSYVSEITNDLYGNGFSIDADCFTHALDGNDQPLLDRYRGPLYFVEYKQTASVAGQDNCAFLIRKDGVKLYGVNLLGCRDESLSSASGGYDLTNLNLAGTTLEINADCSIVNCRIRNGRNVVRAYGGNRDGSKYFLDSLAENTGCDGERIRVTIEGCILSHAREFLLKIGANRALRANNANGREPRLLDAYGREYPVNGAENWYELLGDEYFYNNYVMTDVTLKNSVLETSGLFTVGIESNFSGKFLYEGTDDHAWRTFTRSWEYSGGTSFPSVLRLEGDVRLYDWKDLDLIDSSTLIESPLGALSEWLKLDVRKMIEYVYSTNPGSYGDLLDNRGETQYVHGGIAYYGGGRNYSQLDVSKLDGKYRDDLTRFHINISVLSGADDPAMQRQGSILPNAAGTNDFNFFLYGKSGANNYDAQLRDAASGAKYKGVKPVSAF